MARRPVHLANKIDFLLGAQVAVPWRLRLSCHATGSRPSLPAIVSRSLDGQARGMASYTLNRRAVAHARRLIDARQYVLDSDWGEAQPRADDENRFLDDHDWDEYAMWF